MTDVSIGVNSIQISGKVSGISGPDGRIKSNLSIDSGDGVRLFLPAAMFPFCRPNQDVFCVIAVMQVNQEVPVIEQVKSSLIIPR